MKTQMQVYAVWTAALMVLWPWMEVNLATTGAAPAPAPAGGAAPAAQAAAPDKPPMKQEELDALLAPIALYPDDLVSQILMASTYPVEIVQASRWATANKGLKGDELGKALEKQTWDPSVKSLVNFPDVLTMMNEKIDWTVKLGDAFLGQQKEVLATVQSLRAKAQAAGNLTSNEQQKVEMQEQDNSKVIVIQSTNPDVIYVPTYNPTVVYGYTWPPAYPPYYYYPPGYVAGGAALAFGLGVACGVAWGYAWGNCNWGGNNVNIDIDRNVNRNTNIDRTKINANDRKGNWNHDASHRKGASYRDNKTASQYGRGNNSGAAQSREQYRGRAEAGQKDLSRGPGGTGGAGGTGARPGTGGGAGNTGARPGGGSAGSPGSAGGGNRAATTNNQGGAFNGASQSGNTARTNSSRGSSSRSASPSPSARPSGGGGRPSGGGGGGSRGGGGGRGGGGRR